MKCKLATLLMLLLATPLLAGETYTGKCVGVHDGDTISVMKAGVAVKIRLEGIDCPELGQDFGTRAKQFTSGMVFGKDVQVKEYNLDMYGRMVARVYVEGKDLCLELVKVGLAWHYKRYSSDPVLADAEVEARKAKAGLWSMPNPVPPWGSIGSCIGGWGRPDLPALPYWCGTPWVAVERMTDLTLESRQ